MKYKNEQKITDMPRLAFHGDLKFYSNGSKVRSSRHKRYVHSCTIAFGIFLFFKKKALCVQERCSLHVGRVRTNSDKGGKGSLKDNEIHCSFFLVQQNTFSLAFFSSFSSFFFSSIVTLEQNKTHFFNKMREIISVHVGQVSTLYIKGA